MFGVETSSTILPNDDVSALEKFVELSPETTYAVNAVGDSSSVVARDTTISKVTDQE